MIPNSPPFKSSSTPGLQRVATHRYMDFASGILPRAGEAQCNPFDTPGFVAVKKEQDGKRRIDLAWPANLPVSHGAC
jgi:hypothetical protein